MAVIFLPTAICETPIIIAIFHAGREPCLRVLVGELWRFPSRLLRVLAVRGDVVSWVVWVVCLLGWEVSAPLMGTVAVPFKLMRNGIGTILHA